MGDTHNFYPRREKPVHRNLFLLGFGRMKNLFLQDLRMLFLSAMGTAVLHA